MDLCPMIDFRHVGLVKRFFLITGLLLSKGQTVCLLGSSSALGSWATDKPILLSRGPDDDYFSTELDLTAERFPFAYKYGVYDVQAGQFIRYEDGANRLLEDPPSPGRQ